MALVLPLDVPRPLQNRSRDEALRLTRVRERSMASTVFIDTNSIIRGGLLVEDHTSEDGKDRFIVDVTDEDMWMRMKGLELVAHAKI
jgi:hypothetical protein